MANHFFTPHLQTFFRRYLELDTSRPDGKNYAATLTLLESELKVLGFTCERFPIPAELCPGPNREHLVARLGHNPKLPTLLIYNHIDVVPGEYPDAFTYREKAGYILARGAADMKGCTAAVLAALAQIKTSQLKYNLVFWATTDEETEQLAQLRYMQPHLNLPAQTLVFDPDTLAGGVTVAHLGAVQLTIKVSGQAVHSAMSHLGRNAVVAASQLVTGFFEPLREALEKQHSRYQVHSGYGMEYLTSRCNVNLIQGGTAPNVIPDSCTFTVDCRVIPEQQAAAVHDEITSKLDTWCAEHQIEAQIVKTVMLAGTSCQDPAASHLNQLYQANSGEGGLFGAPGSTPLAQFAQEAGWPHIGLGVIRSDSQMHGIDEKVAIQDIETVAKTINQFIQE